MSLRQGAYRCAPTRTGLAPIFAIVNRISRQEFPRRAGVGSEQLGRLVDLGIVDPADDGSFSAGDVRRAQLVQGLVEAGLPVEATVEAIERGFLSLAFLDLPVYDRFSQLSGVTFQELSAQQTIPLELLMVLREAIGFARPHPDDPVRDHELRVVPLIKLQLSRGFRPAVIEGWLRVYGESLRRIAETETAWWHTEIEEPRLASGSNEAEMLEAAARWGDEVTSLTQQALLAIYHAHQEHAWSENLIEVVEQALDRAGLRSRIARPPTMCFLDITGYTRLTEERGDEAAAQLAAQVSRLVHRAADRYRGKVVKWLGDGVMLHFREPGPAVLATIGMMEDISGSGLPPAHVGLHVGSVVFQGGDYFGRTVNIAARIAEHARPGELLVSQDVVDASVLEDVTFSAIGPVELKGVSTPIRLHAAHRR
jgi:adenylate cyclase